MPEELRIRNKEFYQALPKVELHRHLEGSLRLSTMLDIARTHSLDLPHNDEAKFRSLVQVVESDIFTFQNFLSKFATLRKFYQSPEAIRRIAYETIADAAADNIRYLEMRFTPVALTRVRDFPVAEAMDWVIEAVNAASDEHGVTTRLIASVNRHESVKLANEVMQYAVERMGRGIVGLDLAGSEAEFPGDEFTPIFQVAKQSGMKITIHAGEWGGPEIVRLAINTLGADRIGHGVRVLEDPKVVELSKRRNITFEVSPTSNYQSGVITQINHHPLMKMLEAGLSCTINTDDPGISRIDLSDEYQLSCKILGLSEYGLKLLILNAARASFLPDHEQKQLAGNLERELSEYLKEE